MLNRIKNLQKTQEQGFTLIELLVVIVIIGVLAAISLPIFLNQQKAAHEAALKNDIKNVATSLQTTATKNGGVNLSFKVSLTNKEHYEQLAVSNFLICHNKYDYAIVARSDSNTAYSYNSQTGKLEKFTANFPNSYTIICPALGYDITSEDHGSQWGFNMGTTGWTYPFR